MITKVSILRRVRARAVLLIAMAMVLTGCDFSVYKLPLPGGADTGENPVTITVNFPDVLDLVPQTTVKVNDVTVGKVRDIELEGYQAVVTLELRQDVDLRDNATAEIRQTSLLGEKFVSLANSDQPSAGRLSDGDKIEASATNRNPEVEEVLGALSLLLNGGGVGQLKTITVELNKVLDGKNGSVRSVLNRLETFMGQLSTNRTDIVNAIDSLNRLAKTANRQKADITTALDELPSALDSVNSQRRDLVKMLRGLARLSNVGTQVISRSKNVTIDALNQLQPVLTKLADSGDALANSFNVLLTYPFVDEAVGSDPQVARNLHIGDYTNLSIKLNIDVGDTLELACTTLKDLEKTLEGQPLQELTDLLKAGDLCSGAVKTLNTCLDSLDPVKCLGGLGDLLSDACPPDPTGLIRDLCSALGGALGGGNGGGSGGNLTKPLEDLLNPTRDLLGGLGNGLGNGLGLSPRGTPAFDPRQKSATLEELSQVHDPVLVGLLMPGVAK